MWAMITGILKVQVWVGREEIEGAQIDPLIRDPQTSGPKRRAEPGGCIYVAEPILPRRAQHIQDF